MASRTGLRDRIQSLDASLTGPLTLSPGRGPAQLLALGLAHSGDSFIWAGLCVLAWFLGNTQWKMRAVIVFAGLVLAEIVVVGIKMCIRRPRPPGESGKIYRRADPFSFPSGHAARAAMLSFLAIVLGPCAAALGIAVWSPFMIVSRIAIGIHYVFDVVGGILLGVLLTLALLGLTPLLTTWLSVPGS